VDMNQDSPHRSITALSPGYATNGQPLLVQRNRSAQALWQSIALLD
jgi:hypothetical protein